MKINRKNYFVVAQIIMSYLYACMISSKNGYAEKFISENSRTENEKKYWYQVLYNLTDAGYIKGALDKKIQHSLTHNGIMFMMGDCHMKEAAEWIKMNLDEFDEIPSVISEIWYYEMW